MAAFFVLHEVRLHQHKVACIPYDRLHICYPYAAGMTCERNMGEKAVVPVKGNCFFREGADKFLMELYEISRNLLHPCPADPAVRKISCFIQLQPDSATGNRFKNPGQFGHDADRLFPQKNQGDMQVFRRHLSSRDIRLP